MNEKIIELDDKKDIIKRYKLRHAGAQGSSIETTIPKDVLEREARKLGIKLEDIVDKLEAVWRYNGFNGVYLYFEPLRDE